MNNPRRKKLQAIIDQLEELKSSLEELQEEEEECRDNMPENLQGSERYERADEAFKEYNPIESGKKIAMLRMAKGYSQKELAEILGVTQQNIHQIESGKKKISLKMLSGMMQVFETTSDYLLGFSTGLKG